MNPMVDRFESWLQASQLYLKVRSVLRRCPASVQKLIDEMEDECLKPSRTADEREHACATIAAALMAHASNEDSPARRASASAKNERMLAFAERLKTLRKQKGLTQAGLAKSVALRQSAISMMENGQCRPQPSTLARLAKALQVAVQDLWPMSSPVPPVGRTNGSVSEKATARDD